MDGIVFAPSHILRLKDHRLDMLNVKYLMLASGSPEYQLFIKNGRFPSIYNDRHVAIFENKSALPRAFTVPLGGLEVYGAINDQLGRLRNPEFDPRQSVIAATMPVSLKDLKDSAPSPGSLLNSNVEMTQSHINDLSFHTITPRPSILVVSQTYYPGWKASVDGTDVEVFPVNIALTGIALPSGAHEVRFEFRPASFKIGTAVTLLSTVLLVAFILI